MNHVYKTFELKEEHLKLLAHAELEMQDMETGAPAIDPKRPYGNSFVAGDVAEILGIELKEDDREQAHELLAIHFETLDALQIILHLRTFELGLYEKVGNNAYQTSWRKAQ